MLVMMVAYFPMNNQVLSFTPTGLAFWVILAGWYASRRSHTKSRGRARAATDRPPIVARVARRDMRELGSDLSLT